MGTIQKLPRKNGTTAYKGMVRLQGHEPLYRTFDRRTDAKDWVRSQEQRIKVGETISSEAARTTLHDALKRYAREVTPRKKGSRAELVRIKVWQRHKLAQRYLSKLQDGAPFAEYRDERRAEGAAENTIRLSLALISHLFTIARKDWGMASLRNPIQAMTLPDASNERTRRLKEGEEERLLAALALEGAYMPALASLAIETAMRQGELLGLAWGAVDVAASIAHLADTKGGEPRAVPLSPKAVEILKALPRSLVTDAPIFPVKADEVHRAFKRACTAAGIEGLRFHDLRREAVSRLFERGLGLHEVAAISGHRTWSQLRRYTVVKPEALVVKLAKEESMSEPKREQL